MPDSCSRMEPVVSLEDRALGLIHQFGKDLCWIRSAARTLLQAPSALRLESNAKTISEVTEEMAASVRDLLDEARLEVQPAMPLPDAVSDAIARVTRHHSNVRIECSGAGGDHTSDVHPSFRDALVDILDNAARATEGGGRIEVSLLSGVDRGVRVADFGIGMDPDTLASCTERGFTTRLEDGGHGLGLSVCRNILASLGGRLDLESERGRGTVATLRLPPTPGEPSSGQWA